MKKYDLCIVGAGPAGCACAYIASKLGLKTVIVEKNNYLGGLMTGGLVVPVMKTNSLGINVTFFNDLVCASKKFGAQIEYFDGNKGWFNPNLMKIVLDSMLDESGADVLFELSPKKVFRDEKSVTGIDFESNILSLHIDSKYFLDSSGDSIIFKLLGLNFYENNLKKQPASLRFVMSGVDIKKLKNFLEKIDPSREVTNFCETGGEIHLTSACTWDDEKKWNLWPLFKKGVEKGELKPFDTSYFQIFTMPGAPGSVAFNCPRLRDYSPMDPYDFSCALKEARAAIFRLSKFMIKNFEGFEKAYISQIADMTGVRESNKIVAKKQFTISDLTKGEKPETPALAGDYPIDVHSNDKNKSSLIKTGEYFMPVESLISKDYENLYAAGKNPGADNLAHSAIRTQLSCMSMGEAVALHVAKLLT